MTKSKYIAEILMNYYLDIKKILITDSGLILLLNCDKHFANMLLSHIEKVFSIYVTWADNIIYEFITHSYNKYSNFYEVYERKSTS